MRLEPTEQELQRIKDHFEARGYGVIDDETARAQKDLLRAMRNGNYERWLEREKQNGAG